MKMRSHYVTDFQFIIIIIIIIITQLVMLHKSDE
jgi:hypothetical protein